MLQKKQDMLNKSQIELGCMQAKCPESAQIKPAVSPRSTSQMFKSKYIQCKSGNYKQSILEDKTS